MTRSPESNRAAVRAALSAGLPAKVEDIVSTIRAQIPAYATLSADQLAEVTAIADWGIRRALDLWVTDQDLTPADLQRFRGIGAARALDGRPLPGVLRAYRLAGRAVMEMVMSSAGENLTVADAMAFANLWTAGIDGLSEALYEGHAEATDRMSNDRERALADLLVDLVDGRQVTLTALADRSRQLGITLPARPTVLVVTPADPVTGLTGMPAAGDPAEAVLRTTRGRRGVIVTGPETGAAIASAVSGNQRGCAVAAAGTRELPGAYRLANLALDLAPEHAYRRRPVLDEGDAQVLALLTANPLADPSRTVECVLGAATGPDNAHLLEGLQAFLAYGSAAAAAQHLDLHPQSMRYRLRRLCHLTGRDLRHPWDRFVLEAASRAAARDGRHTRSAGFVFAPHNNTTTRSPGAGR